MKKRLTSMFLVAYILLGILGFFLVTFAGSHMLEARLEKVHYFGHIPDSPSYRRK